MSRNGVVSVKVFHTDYDGDKNCSIKGFMLEVKASNTLKVAVDPAVLLRALESKCGPVETSIVKAIVEVDLNSGGGKVERCLPEDLLFDKSRKRLFKITESTIRYAQSQRQLILPDKVHVTTLKPMKYGAPKKSVTVKTLTGATIRVAVRGNERIDILKGKIQDKTGIPLSEIKLICDGKLIAENNRTLEDYNIQRNVVLHLVLALMFHPTSARSGMKELGENEFELAVIVVDGQKTIKPEDLTGMLSNPLYVRYHVGDTKASVIDSILKVAH